VLPVYHIQGKAVEKVTSLKTYIIWHYMNAALSQQYKKNAMASIWEFVLKSFLRIEIGRCNIVYNFINNNCIVYLYMYIL